MRITPLVIIAALLTGCGQSIEDRRAEVLAAEPQITPGIYGNVRLYRAPAMDKGMEIELARGSESEVVQAILCEMACPAVQTRPVRRGLGGVSFTLPVGERLVDVSVQPDGADAVYVTADWGNGVERQRLGRISRPIALDQSRNRD